MEVDRSQLDATRRVQEDCDEEERSPLDIRYRVQEGGDANLRETKDIDLGDRSGYCFTKVPSDCSPGAIRALTFFILGGFGSLCSIP